jgi:hypothetical protein
MNPTVSIPPSLLLFGTMASAEDFRRIALSFPGAEEGSHMKHPDFRVGGKVFATLGYPGSDWAMVQLMPEQQEDFMSLAPDAFQPASGAWGRKGSTLVKLAAVQGDMLETALNAAWRRRAPAADA